MPLGVVSAKSSKIGVMPAKPSKFGIVPTYIAGGSTGTTKKLKKPVDPVQTITAKFEKGL
jgi:hypothetical protein